MLSKFRHKPIILFIFKLLILFKIVFCYDEIKEIEKETSKLLPIKEVTKLEQIKTIYECFDELEKDTNGQLESDKKEEKVKLSKEKEKTLTKTVICEINSKEIEMDKLKNWKPDDEYISELGGNLLMKFNESTSSTAKFKEWANRILTKNELNGEIGRNKQKFAKL
uniref:Uncharacterized protein n=1 Tax=Meloidogyne hapla TaxID=6305 RepID=A0A1I8C0K3_MELHA